MKKIVKIASIILVSVFIVTQTNSQAHADEIVNIAGFTELAKCYKKNIIKPEISTVSDKFKVKDIFDKKEDSETFAAVPNMYQNTIADYNVSCKQLVNGYDTIGGGKYDALINNNENELGEAAAKEFLKKMGYTSNGNGGKYVNFTYKKTDWLQKQSEVHTHKIKVTDIKNGKITNSSIIEIEKSGFADLVKFDVYNKTTLQIYCDPTDIISPRAGCSDITISSGTSFESFAQEVYNQLAAHRQTYTKYLGGLQAKSEKYVLLKYDPSNNIQNGANQGDDGKWVFIGKSEAKAADAAVKNNSNFDSVSSLIFTAEQKTTLHQFYFNEFYRAKLICNGDEGYDSLPAGAIEAIKSGDKTCYAIAMAHVDSDNPQDKVHAITPKLTWYVDYTFEQLVKNMTEDELLGAQTAANSTDDGETSEAERAPDCHTKAGALGWILCPVIDIASDTVEKVYTELIMPYLSIDAALFDLNEPGGVAVRNVWSLFQGFANLAFVILFLFVIFSQLSGVGIDNYGIKKILPKLIIGAVLINLSYIICQLAVDLSNILGRAIADMFSKFAEGINNTLAAKPINLYPNKASDVSIFSDIANNKAVIVSIAGALGLGAFLAAGPAIIIPAVLALISVVIGIFFLFVLLALRQAIAVILVVVSPMAFAMYILPNTKSIFDKWYQTFKGMLLAFPIASALVFGGDFVSKILLAADGEGTITSLGLVLSAAAVAVAPIFFIPDVIRKSMGALSGIANFMQRGQKSASSRLGKGASDGIRNSGLQRANNQFNERRRAGINRKGELSVRGRLQNKLAFTAGQRAKIAEQRNKALGYVGADKTNRRMLTDAGIAATSAGIAAKARQQEINDEITNMATETGNYNTDVMESMLAGYMSQENLNSTQKMKAKALMTKLSQAGGDGNKRLANIIRGKAKDENGNTALMSDAGRKLFADYATNSDVANNISDKDAYVAQYLRDMQAEQAKSGSTGITNKTTFDQWATKSGSAGRKMSNEEFVATKQLDDDEHLMRQSGDSLEQTMLIHGAVTQARAQRILDNDNINKKQSQIDKLETTGAKMRTPPSSGKK